MFKILIILIVGLFTTNTLAQSPKARNRDNFPWIDNTAPYDWKDPDDFRDEQGNISRWQDLANKLPDKVMVDGINPNWKVEPARICDAEYRRASKITTQWVEFLHQKRSADDGPILEDRVIYLDARIRVWVGPQLYKINHLALRQPQGVESLCRKQADFIVEIVESRVWNLYEKSCKQNPLNAKCEWQ